MKKGSLPGIGSMAKIILIVLVLFIILTAINGLYGQTFNDGIKKLLGEKTDSEITHEKNLQVKKSFDNLEEQIKKCSSSDNAEIFHEDKFINYPEFNGLGNLILSESRTQNTDPLMVAAFIKKESTFNKDIISACGAVGLSQMMPDSAKESGLKVPQYSKIDVEGCNIAYECNSKTPEKCDKLNDERFNPQKSVQAGIYYFNKKLEINKDDFRLALAAYNGGDSANVDSTKVGCIGKKAWECETTKGYEQTRNYVEKITNYYEGYKSIFYIKSRKESDETCGCSVNLKEFNNNYELRFSEKEIKIINAMNARERSEESGVQMASFDAKLNCYWDDNFESIPLEAIYFEENPFILKEIKIWTSITGKGNRYYLTNKFNILKANNKLCWLADNVDESGISTIQECK